VLEIEPNADDLLLEKMGYKPELHRGFSGFMNFSFCFTAVSVISGCSLLFPFGLQTGGPVVMVWGWLLGSVFSTIVGLSMAEICSSYPSAGSVYHWAGMLAPREWAPISSYLCGWFNFIGNAAGDASFAFGFAQVLTATIALETDGTVRPGVGSNVVLAVAVSALWAVKNLMRVDHQGWFNNASAIYQLASTVVIILTIVIASPQLSSASFVFGNYNNETGIESRFYVSCIGLLMCLFSFSGYEGGAHMAEETHNAAASAPRGLIYTCLVTAGTGFVYITGLLFACQNTTDVFNGESDYAVVNVYIKAFTDSAGVHLKTGSVIMTLLLLVNVFCAGFSSLTVTSRIGFAMARDRAFPYSHVLHKVHPTTKAPHIVIALVFVLDVLFCLMPLISQTAFEAITSIAAIGFQISYAIPILLRLTVARNTFIKSEAFNLGRWSLPLGWLAVVWLVVTSCFFVLPEKYEAGMFWENFNWTGVVLALVLLTSLVYWYLPAPMGARHFFKGPKRTDDN